jgi:RNA polymerase sigma-70 factor (ECF subfamily)
VSLGSGAGVSEHATEGVGASPGSGAARAAASLRPELDRLCERLLGATAEREALVERALTGLLPEGLATASEPRVPALAATARACVDVLRRAGGEPLFEARDRDPADLFQAGPSPLASASGFQVGQRLAAALHAMPRRYAVLLVLRYQAELGYAELAELLSVDRGEIGILLYRARRALRAALSKEAT